MPEWFESWFDSKYYHILYDNRDFDEAEAFLSNICSHMKWASESSLLDLACGAGRHSMTLAKMGYDVLGMDLSPASIKEAKSKAVIGAHFEVGDMRTFQLGKKFDAVLNLFTSFGYFVNSEENVEVLKRVHEHLKPNGHLVIDFLNPTRVVDGLVESEVIEKQGVKFEIGRKITKTHVVKRIEFVAEGTRHSYEERVQLFDLADFENMLTENGFFLENVFGSYQLDDFSARSDRQIIIARRE